MMIRGDARQLPLADGCVQTVVTSPPYWGLRDYGTARWDGGDSQCGHKPNVQPRTRRARNGLTGGLEYMAAQEPTYRDLCGMCGARRVDNQIGLEPTLEEYVTTMVEVFREVRRVLKDDGTVWLNLGDSYATRPYGDGHTYDPKYGGRNRANGYPNRQKQLDLKHKDLCMVPARVALALQGDGWWLRSDIVWAKPNPMPESVTDRPTRSHEYVFLLAKSERYFFDADAIREPHTSDCDGANSGKWEHNLDGTKHGDDPRFRYRPGSRPKGYFGSINGRNKRDVWTINSEATPEAHFATFSQKLVEPCVLAGTSAKGECSRCGANWVRVTEQSRATHPTQPDDWHVTGRSGLNRQRVGEPEKLRLATTQSSIAEQLRRAANGRTDEMRGLFGSKWDHWTRTDDSGARIPIFEDAAKLKELLGVDLLLQSGEVGGWRPTCTCDTPTRPNLVLDPFIGSGTVGMVCERLGRRWVGVELSAEYVAIAKRRTAQRGLFGQ